MTPIERLLRDGPAVGAGDVAAATAAALAAADAEGLVDVAVARVDSPIGQLTVAATSAGLVRVAFPREVDTVVEDLAARVSPRVVELPSKLDGVRRQLDEYFAGRRRRFDVPVDLRLARGFRRTVLELLHDRVGFGETRSYAELAVLAGSPGASRAVGTAMATNPVPIVVPCHRVLRSGGALGGYGGGLDVKRWLLALEGGEAQSALTGWQDADPSAADAWVRSSGGGARAPERRSRPERAQTEDSERRRQDGAGASRRTRRACR